MLVESKAMKLYCDGCEEQYETLNGYTAFCGDEDGKEILCDAFDNDWKTFEGKHYCPNCWWNDEEDDNIVHTKDGKKWNDSTGKEIKEE